MEEENVVTTYVPPGAKKKKATTQNNKKSSHDRTDNAVKHEDYEAVENKIKQIKLGPEASVVGCLYKDPDLFLDCDLSPEDFSTNSWRVFFVIASELYNKEHKTITEDNINFYLEKHPALSERYEWYKGYDTIITSMKSVDVKNFNSFVRDINKWNAVLKIAKLGFPVLQNMSKYADMSADEIYDELTLQLNHAFVSVDEQIKSYNAFENLAKLNDRLKQGVERGKPFAPLLEANNDSKRTNMDILNRVVNGFNLNGNIYGLGACTGVGKSWMALEMLLPMVLNGEPLVMIINEEDHTKIMREIEVWVANNIIKKTKVQKQLVAIGKIDKLYQEALDEAIAYIEQKQKEYAEKNNTNTPLFTIVPLERYNVSTAIKIIKKYRALGVKMFCLDTLKESYDSRNVDTWKAMERDLVELYNTVKPAAKGGGVGLFITYQLGKQAVKLRYLTNTEVGQAKNIMDVITVNLMIRKVYSDEYEGSKQIKINTGKTGETKIPLSPDPEHNHLAMFITKNRNGSTDPFQIIYKVHQGLNTIEEVGIANITPDF